MNVPKKIGHSQELLQKNQDILGFFYSIIRNPIRNTNFADSKSLKSFCYVKCNRTYVKRLSWNSKQIAVDPIMQVFWKRPAIARHIHIQIGYSKVCY